MSAERPPASPASPDRPGEPAVPTPEELVRTLAKRELRKRMRGLRVTTPASKIEARSAAVRDRLLTLAAVQSARAVAVFWPIEARHELDLRPFAARLREMGKQIAYPFLGEEPGSMGFRLVVDDATLAERGHGFAEPAEDAPAASPGELSVVIVPALALDARGARLGYGAGYYDRALPRFCPPAVSVGVCFSFQLLGEIPTTSHDVPVDLIVTDETVLDPRAANAPDPASRGFDRREPGVKVVRRR